MEGEDVENIPEKGASHATLDDHLPSIDKVLNEIFEEKK